MSACLSHPCLHGGTCVDTYFLHNNVESLNMYSSPSIIDTQQNGMSYICKCISPYSGHSCEGKPIRQICFRFVGKLDAPPCEKYNFNFGRFQQLSRKRSFGRKCVSSLNPACGAAQRLKTTFQADLKRLSQKSLF